MIALSFLTILSLFGFVAAEDVSLPIDESCARRVIVEAGDTCDYICACDQG